MLLGLTLISNKHLPLSLSRVRDEDLHSGENNPKREQLYLLA